MCKAVSFLAPTVNAACLLHLSRLATSRRSPLSAALRRRLPTAAAAGWAALRDMRSFVTATWPRAAAAKTGSWRLTMLRPSVHAPLSNNILAIATCPLAEAFHKADSLTQSSAVASAPSCSKSATTCVSPSSVASRSFSRKSALSSGGRPPRPASAWAMSIRRACIARCNGVQPELFLMVGLASSANNCCVSAKSPLATASVKCLPKILLSLGCSGVPLSDNHCATVTWPFRAAHMSGVSPALFTASWSAPTAINALTISKFPDSAA
mmetsp:Transcript_36545/g.105270  ORF Transcript_36545/g.105270 Transcript_36545/m.105270 type:complete len:267 (+) Transcript_36545:236-1036(+)